MQIVTLRSKFTLSIVVKKSDREKIEKMLDPNEIKYTRWQQNPFNGFIEFRADVNIRQAEVIRKLLKNIQVYD